LEGNFRWATSIHRRLWTPAQASGRIRESGTVPGVRDSGGKPPPRPALPCPPSPCLLSDLPFVAPDHQGGLQAAADLGPVNSALQIHERRVSESAVRPPDVDDPTDLTSRELGPKISPSEQPRALRWPCAQLRSHVTSRPHDGGRTRPDANQIPPQDLPPRPTTGPAPQGPCSI
jgi:hypothetical protein